MEINFFLVSSRKEDQTISDFNAWLYQELPVSEQVERRQMANKGTIESNGKTSKVPNNKGKGMPSTRINHVSTNDPVAKQGGTFTKTGKWAEQGGKGGQPSTAAALDVSKLVCFVCDGQGHRLTGCKRFLNMNPTKRAETVYLDGRCLKCLVSRGHVSKDCPKRVSIRCTVDDCVSRRRHTLLHNSQF